MLGRFTAALLFIGLCGCTPEGYLPKHKTPVPARTLALMSEKNMDQAAPILMRVFKAEAKLEVWKKRAPAHTRCLKSTISAAGRAISDPRSRRATARRRRVSIRSRPCI